MGLVAARRRLRSWARRHSFSFFSSLGSLWMHRVGTLMTVLVLGIAILLPLGLFVTLSNLDRFELEQEDWGAVTVFLAHGAGEPERQQLLEALQAREDVASVRTVSPGQGMAEFRDHSGFGDSLELLGENPLPWVFMVSPATGVLSADAAGVQARVDALTRWLQEQPMVASAQYDLKWLQRLGRLLELGRAIVWVLALLFGVAVIVVVANTIRLDVAARAEEIEILALVGASNSFIRQPFLYSGFWYGLLGGLLALALMQACLLYLGGPLGRLLDTYGQGLHLQGLTATQAAVLAGAAAWLGLLGALASVQRYLKLLSVGGSLGRR